MSQRSRRPPAVLAGLAAVACVACCAVPLLLAAGVMSGAAAAFTGRWLPALAGLLLLTAAGAWWATRRRHHRGCAGGDSCSCPRS